MSSKTNGKNGSGLFFLEPVLEIVETMLYTSCVESEIPGSMIMVAPSGVAKSMAIKRYLSESLHHTDSISSQGLYDIAARDHKQEVRFLMIPDMNPTLSRKAATVQSTIANLLSFTADGTVRIDDGRSQKECKHSPVGLVTAATPDIYNAQAKKWFALGLRRRILPIFFQYSRDTTRKLQALVRNQQIHSTAPPAVKVKIGFKSRPEIPEGMTHKIEALSLSFAMLLGKLCNYDETDAKKRWRVRDVVPISPQITLMTLARAHALRRNKQAKICEEDDYAFICKFLDFCDPEHPKEI